MVVAPILPHAEFGRNDHREDTANFTKSFANLEYCSFIEIMAYES